MLFKEALQHVRECVRWRDSREEPYSGIVVGELIYDWHYDKHIGAELKIVKYKVGGHKFITWDVRYALTTKDGYTYSNPVMHYCGESQ